MDFPTITRNNVKVGINSLERTEINPQYLSFEAKRNSFLYVTIEAAVLSHHYNTLLPEDYHLHNVTVNRGVFADCEIFKNVLRLDELPVIKVENFNHLFDEIELSNELDKNANYIEFVNNVQPDYLSGLITYFSSKSWADENKFLDGFFHNEFADGMALNYLLFNSLLRYVDD